MGTHMCMYLHGSFLITISFCFLPTHDHSVSHSVVLSELVSSEFTYVQSLEALVETYLPMFSDDHIPTYLQGKRDMIFANLEQIYGFQRYFRSQSAALY